MTAAPVRPTIWCVDDPNLGVLADHPIADENLAAYERDHPDVQIVLRCGTPEAAVEALLAPIVDATATVLERSIVTVRRASRLIVAHLAGRVCRSSDADTVTIPYRLREADVVAAIRDARERMEYRSASGVQHLAGTDDSPVTAVLRAAAQPAGFTSLMDAFASFEDAAALRDVEAVCADGAFRDLHPRRAA